MKGQKSPILVPEEEKNPETLIISDEVLSFGINLPGLDTPVYQIQRDYVGNIMSNLGIRLKASVPPYYAPDLEHSESRKIFCFEDYMNLMCQYNGMIHAVRTLFAKNCKGKETSWPQFSTTCPAGKKVYQSVTMRELYRNEKLLKAPGTTIA